MSDQSTIPDAGLCRLVERATRQGVHLTLQEAKIVELLDGGGLVSRRALIDHLWGDDPDGGPVGAHKQVSVVIHRLRRKGFSVQNHHGLGYSLAAWPGARP